MEEAFELTGEITIEEVINILKFNKEVSQSTIKKRISESSKDWITLDIIKLIEKRNKYFKRYRREVLQENQQLANRFKLIYETLRKQVKKLIYERKSKFFQDQVKEEEIVENYGRLSKPV